MTVTDGGELADALADARPGDVITMKDGVYTAKGSSVTIGKQNAAAKFRIGVSGTAEKPIILQGSRQAIIDGKPGGDGTGGDYGLHVFKANHWTISGIRITNQKKGLVLDGSSHNVLDGVMVDTIGQEAVHFRSGSSYNTIMNSFVTKTGYSSPGYGEAIYIGSDGGNWEKLYMGSGSDQSDQSDHNQVLNNTITEFTGEGLDIKEASSFNLVKGNYFDGGTLGTDPEEPGAPLKPQNSADSWVDVKGDNNTITENSGVNVPPLDKNSAAFQTHVHGPDGYNSATNNIFTNNKVLSGSEGYLFWIDPKGKGNVLSCSNVAQSGGPGKGFSNLGGCKETGN
ncbi:right-handed parallel beta-helix repeat-containing protein [Frankia sp. CNm7]|uniref:Right-handed parallel beta-helix repeat-containing protein n=1 Tax=Frankia nepalensis TaxID=1836974 RepID=A0A937RGQ4_9ACTN|nr:NosD domain-containing protein [Frankia nepalensis]MBL7495611.1 right-handed parallel beta-helix repeat-containing protein [Frankia nepalensis]MBL7508857.1 right-handed parallel beta-helix repeat-containing protein [Frankia nepalensis]MBL7524226.1 right-handed parallel beta-helix repeat-containing protein [Frankia nepalensis]MBL7630080.1 right-handed parallel beta-helix repeat-containing protein [Frankia nepalensis]